jgi:hypothetical protein
LRRRSTRSPQVATFDDHLDWERYWQGPEMTDFRIRHSSWYQVPVLYGWWDQTAGASLIRQSNGAADAHGNGHGNGGLSAATSEN